MLSSKPVRQFHHVVDIDSVRSLPRVYGTGCETGEGDAAESFFRSLRDLGQRRVEGLAALNAALWFPENRIVKASETAAGAWLVLLSIDRFLISLMIVLDDQL